MVSWEICPLKTVFNNKKINFSVPQMQNMLSKMYVCQSFSVFDLFVSQELSGRRDFCKSNQETRMWTVKFQRKLLGVTVHDRIIGLASGVIKKGCRKNQRVRGTI